MATTLDYGRKLAWNYRFDKLGMNQTLHELEELQASHQVEELSAIEPILRKIANDPNLMHISRQSAQHLLKTSSVPGGTNQSAVQPVILSPRPSPEFTNSMSDFRQLRVQLVF